MLAGELGDETMPDSADMELNWRRSKGAMVRMLAPELCDSILCQYIYTLCLCREATNAGSRTLCAWPGSLHSRPTSGKKRGDARASPTRTAATDQWHSSGIGIDTRVHGTTAHSVYILWSGVSCDRFYGPCLYLPELPAAISGQQVACGSRLA